ncbi:hypothetical protein ACFV4E_22490 [Streptomyces hygroscopicus]|uniref:Uncharacterized protein n=1 Tax=Streptomyces hygroscopicus TaxID=1912 RepID=A0ABQ3UF57_STRHY|nr:hypothetical protein [Streptomyces hygroscopicus]GHJ34235.1 hypothetical protein TPA0910_86680 [Streptomyces hygroscopicus]
MTKKPSGTARVHLGDDYDQGEYFREDPNGEYEIPREQLDRWKAAEDAYRKMQEEIGELIDKRVTDRT